MTFRKWYKQTAVSQQPLPVQAIMWFFYGFIWIPVWYLISRESAGTSKQRLSSYGKTAGIGCLGIGVTLFVLGALVAILNPESVNSQSQLPVREASANGGSITEDFFPIAPGTKRHFSRSTYMGQSEVQSRIEREFTGSGILERTMSQFVPGGGNLPAEKTSDSIQLQRVDDVIETGHESEYSNGMVWSPILKIGATEGDSWERRFENGIVQSYRVAGFKTREINENIEGGGTVECVIVEMRMTAPIGPQTIVESVFARGIGLIREQAWIVENEERVPTRSDIIMPVLLE